MLKSGALIENEMKLLMATAQHNLRLIKASIAIKSPRARWPLTSRGEAEFHFDSILISNAILRINDECWNIYESLI